MNDLNYFIKSWTSNVLAKAALKPVIARIITEIKEESMKSKLKAMIFETIKEIKVEKNEVAKKDMAELEKAISPCTVDLNDAGHYVINGWPDHKVSIRPMSNGVYDVLFIKDNSDREKKLNLNFEEVKKYVTDKIKSKELNYTQKAFNKVAQNSEDTIKAVEGLPKTKQNDIKKVETTKNDNKDYKIDAVENKDDLPDQPLKTVEKTKKQVDHPIKGTKPDYKQPKLDKKESKLTVKPKSKGKGLKKLSDK